MLSHFTGSAYGNQLTGSIFADLYGAFVVVVSSAPEKWLSCFTPEDRKFKIHTPLVISLMGAHYESLICKPNWLNMQEHFQSPDLLLQFFQLVEEQPTQPAVPAQISDCNYLLITAYK